MSSDLLNKINIYQQLFFWWHTQQFAPGIDKLHT